MSFQAVDCDRLVDVVFLTWSICKTEELCVVSMGSLCLHRAWQMVLDVTVIHFGTSSRSSIAFETHSSRRWLKQIGC